jgi:site-specific DNA-cytosine methylase
MTKKEHVLGNANIQPVDVVDLFCGIGGLSYGMKEKGFHIKG